MAQNPTISNLDPGQIIKRVYDEANDQIRINGTTTVEISGDLEVAIDAATGDNISIASADGSKKVDVETIGSKNALDVNVIAGELIASNPSVDLNGNSNPTSSTQIGGETPNGLLASIKLDENGAILVNTSGSFAVQDLKVLFNEVSAIAIGMETVINTYTAPFGKIAYLLTILNSGENRSQYSIYNNGLLLDKQYTNVTLLTTTFDYKTGSGSVPGMVIPVGNTIDVKVTNSGTSISNYNSRFMILEVS